MRTKSPPPVLLLPDRRDPEQILAGITKALESLEPDPAYLEGMRMAVPGVMRLYGGRVPELRAMAKQISKAFRPGPSEAQELARRCWQAGSREHRLIALFLLGGVKGMVPKTRWEIGMTFLPEVADWETCDQLCHALLGQALAEEPGYMDEVEHLARNENLWVRRAALVSTVLLRRARYEPDLSRGLDERALELCETLLEDEEHYIRKAVDWALREVIKRHPQMAYEWMMDRAREASTRVARSTLRSAVRKLPENDRATLLDVLG
ncbi:MAG TPA: DNA alkylation repair protein [Chloroflexi bacterium]|nr:DNA alkylation repair protein [Chloroflexota bacterium]